MAVRLVCGRCGLIAPVACVTTADGLQRSPLGLHPNNFVFDCSVHCVRHISSGSCHDATGSQRNLVSFLVSSSASLCCNCLSFAPSPFAFQGGDYCFLACASHHLSFGLDRFVVKGRLSNACYCRRTSLVGGIMFFGQHCDCLHYFV